MKRDMSYTKLIKISKRGHVWVSVFPIFACPKYQFLGVNSTKNASWLLGVYMLSLCLKYRKSAKAFEMTLGELQFKLQTTQILLL